MVRRIREREQNGRRALRDLGVTEERLPRETQRRRGKSVNPEEHECDVCRATLFLSMVSNAAEETVYCLQHGQEQLTSHPDQLTGSKLLVTRDQVNRRGKRGRIWVLGIQTIRTRYIL